MSPDDSELDGPSPEEFEEDLHQLPECGVPEVPTAGWTTVSLVGPGLSLPLPLGHVVEASEETGVPGCYNESITLDPDTTLHIQRIEAFGWLTHYLHVEGGEELSSHRCTMRVAGRPAEVNLIEYRVADGTQFCAGVNAMIRVATYLGAGVFSSTEQGRAAALTALARSRFISPDPGSPSADQE